MAEFKPNEEQKLFITQENCNLLVSASAGSGKTTTMIQKLLYIMKNNKLPITSILVVTYTNAAASEIKQKLYNEITNLISSTNDLAEKEYFKSQLENINNAEIGTLHSICKKLITKFFYEGDISPDFSLLTDRESTYLLETALNNVFNKYIKDDDSQFFDLYECYNSKRNDTTLKNIILQIINYVNSKVDFEGWKSNFISNSYDANLDKNKPAQYLWVHYKSLISEYIPQIDSLILKMKALDTDKYESFFCTRKNLIEAYLTCDNIVQSIKVISNAVFENKPSKNKSMSVELLDYDEEVDAFNKAFMKLIADIKNAFLYDNESDIIKNIISAKNNVCKILEVEEKVQQEYSKIKKNKNSLDFNDLEDEMLALLNNSTIVNTLRNQYKYVFVDEYQDINDKQEAILQKLVSGDNYYMIGDVKQSIYAFRQSSPKIFISKYNLFKQDNEKNKVIDFNANYRSDKNILEFANTIFDNLITEKTVGIDYKNNARFESQKEFEGVKVNLNIINTDIEDDDEEVDVDKDKAEALVVANEITKIMSSNKSDNTPFEYKDIAIILRQRGTFLKTLCSVLTNMHIPISTKVNNDFFATEEISLLVSILKVVSNYKEDIALATVLKNLFNLDEFELLQIRESVNLPNYYDCVKNYNTSDEICTKINDFFNFLKESKIYLANNSIRDFLLKVLDDYDLNHKILSLPNGFEKESNIEEFLILSDNDNYKYSLDKFLEYLEFISKSKNMQSIGTEGNAVQICTIHYSKGLEYPAVILAGMGKNFQTNKDTNNIIFNNDFGIGLKRINSAERIVEETVIRNACKISNKTQELNEEIRLLYVAMTRAKEKLSIIGKYNASTFRKNKLKNIYSSKNYFEMIFRAFDNIYASNFENSKNFVFHNDKIDACDVVFTDLNKIVFDDEKENREIILNAINTELLESFNNVYNRNISRDTFTIKNNVTNIIKEEVDYELVNYHPVNLNQSDGLGENRDSLKIGTAYHTIMQNLNYDETVADIEHIIENLIAKNKLDRDIVQYVDVNEIHNACKCIGALAKDSKQIYKEKQFLLRENYDKLIKNTDNNTKVIIQGVIDLVIVKEDKVYLIDFKTNKTTNEQFLCNHYSLQLDIYKKAFEKATNLKVTNKYLYSFTLNKLIEII